MNRAVLKLLLLLMLAVAVPAQGIAAVAAGQCMTLEHHQMLDHGSHAHDEADEGHASAGAGEDGAKGSHCGPCTACCASASIAGSVASSLAASSSQTGYSFSQSPPPAVEPDGVYRPPLAL